MLAHRARTDRSFERLYRRHVADVYRYALAVLANPADAEDVTQTTFLNAYRAYQRGQRAERPANWLIVIAQNVCRQRFRQAARRPGVVPLDDNHADAGLVEDEPQTLDEVPIALSRLAFNQRTALVMREIHGYSYAEIAQALDLSQSAVETLLFRARRALREQLENTLTCSEAEHAISRQLDRRLDHRDKVRLRAHLRACPECATLARRMRAQRASLKMLAAVPLPPSLASFFGSNAAVVGGGVATKAAAFGAAALLLGGGGYEAVQHGVPHRSPHPRPDAVTRGRPSAARPISTSVATAVQPMTAWHAPAAVALIRSHRPKALTSRARSEPPPRAAAAAVPEAIGLARAVTMQSSVDSPQLAPRLHAASVVNAARANGKAASAPGHTKRAAADPAQPAHPKARSASMPAAPAPATSQPVPEPASFDHGNGNGDPYAEHGPVDNPNEAAATHGPGH